MKTFLLFLFAIFLIPNITEAKLSKKQLIPLLKEYNEAVQLGDPYAIGVAVKKLAKDDSVRVSRLIFKVAIKFEEPRVHQACVEALREIKSKKALGYLFKKMAKNSDWRVQILLIQALGKKRGSQITSALVRALKSRYAPVLLTTIRALSRRRDRQAILPLIGLLIKRDKKEVAGTISFEIRKCLNDITGTDYPTGKEWQKWWDVAGKLGPSAGVQGRTVIRKIKRKGPRFFTEVIVSEKVLFLIDVSASMEEKDPYPPGKERKTVIKRKKPLPLSQLPPSRMRVERAKTQLIRAIRGLSSKTQFNIIAFQSKIKTWSGQMRRATGSNKSSAIQFILQFRARGKTATYSAIKEAFKNRKADTFYLLSDGTPTIGPSPASILEFVYKKNRFRRISIYTLGFPGADRGFMMKLAQENHGRYSDIR